VIAVQTKQLTGEGDANSHQATASSQSEHCCERETFLCQAILADNKKKLMTSEKSPFDNYET
jgi:hypothetical protein